MCRASPLHSGVMIVIEVVLRPDAMYLSVCGSFGSVEGEICRVGECLLRELAIFT